MTPAARPLFWPLVPLYRLGLAVQDWRFRPGSGAIRRLQWPVVSIGNLSTGGSGKTPLTIALARALTLRGVAVNVLSRGYGRRSKAPARVNPGGTVHDFGDEPLLIAQAADVPVYVAAERYEAGLLAEHYAAEDQGVHLLDDGFQHRQLHRDVNILLLSRNDLADHLLPAGNLREALHAAVRADVLAIPADEPEVADWARSLGWSGKLWRVRRRMKIPQFDGPAVAFCGIARPGQFFRGLEAADVPIATRVAFPDHYRYSADDMERIALAARVAGAQALLTTEKDRVRLGTLATALPLYTVGLRMEIEDEEAALDWLRQRLTAPRQE